MKQILLLFVAVLLVGCALGGKKMIPIASSELPPLRVDSKNYVINKSLQVNTGDTLIRRQKYVVRRWDAKKVRITNLTKANALLEGKYRKF